MVSSRAQALPATIEGSRLALVNRTIRSGRQKQMAPEFRGIADRAEDKG